MRGRELLRPLLTLANALQLQAENAKQAEAMAKLVERLESLDTQIVDTQDLIAALQGQLPLSDKLVWDPL